MPASPFLICTACATPLDPDARDSCRRCGATYDLVNGEMVSFLPPGAHTALDAIDYDSVYSVDADNSYRLYRQCRRFLGDLLPSHASSYLEVGAGTGLFTLGYLGAAPPERALVTDISPKMLEVCRRRLHSAGIEHRTQVSYALWDGTQRCFANGAFDLVAGFSVLHHILDYRSVLGLLHDAMSEGGRAIFLEPSLAFHHAMVSHLANVVTAMPADEPGWSPEYSAVVGCWIAENYLNIKYRGDELALERREDKHIFDEQSLRAAGAAAGFGSTHVIPFAEADETWTTFNVYINQLPIPAEAKALILLRCASMMPGPFFYLAPDERAPSFLVVFEKTAESPGCPARRAVPDTSFSHPEPSFRFDLEIRIDSVDEANGTVRGVVSGWILGDIDVQYVQLERGGRARFPVAGLRLDVANAMNAAHRLPPERAMCSGVTEVRDQRIAHSDVEPIDVVAACSGGARYKLGEIAPGQGSIRLESIAGLLAPSLQAAEAPPSPSTAGGAARANAAECA